ncbi:peptidylprolyl isomerase [Psittacicella hinzii]|uniref:Peptidyl-prolyl cis-trans isomerase n=1 Tax=Psittacicella hinzii TaxID=2028575 RepID=A0A3A1YE72_9GAMM|nr:peptidylprolyl isomerase [Psittacicella hinzii]RIY36472.1 hypothetical protein CKF58_05780 [Psittacicella hinzii]
MSNTIAKVQTRVMLETSFGNISIGLYDDQAPESVANFLQYVDEGFYDNTIFHRLVKNFVLQGGGYDVNGEEKITRAPVKNESQNLLSNAKFTVAYARTMAPHSATSQFYINLKDNAFLDYKEGASAGSGQWGYTVFGEVLEGNDLVLETSNNTQTDRRDVPTSPLVILKAYRLN